MFCEVRSLDRIHSRRGGWEGKGRKEDENTSSALSQCVKKNLLETCMGRRGGENKKRGGVKEAQMHDE